MALTQAERMAVMETKVDNIDSNIHDIKDMLENHIEACDKKYAGKWTEKGIMFVIGAIITGFITILIMI